MYKIAHLTSAHPRNDIRILFKQCHSLVACGYEVILIVADGKGDEFKDDVQVIDAGKLSGRLNRMFKTTRSVFKKAVSVNADVYQLHDPELIPVGLKLKRLGKKVVFDAHEDVPRQLLSKPYLGRVAARVLSFSFALFERFACARFDGILTATPFIRDKFLKINANTIDIKNYPLIGELDSLTPWEQKPNEVCYVGGISSIRGIREIVHACEHLNTPARLNLVGRFSEPDFEAEIRCCSGWSKVNEHGYLDRSGVKNVLERSMVGLVTLHPTPNHLDSLPIKMFEYMSSGIPVIASKFPLWKEIIEGNDCGLIVDPLDPNAIARAIDHLVQNPIVAKRMGENGRRAVLEKYNWSLEEQKLLQFYSQISKDWDVN